MQYKLLVFGVVLMGLGAACGGDYDNDYDEVDAYFEVRREVESDLYSSSRYDDRDPYEGLEDYPYPDYEVNPCDLWPEDCAYEPDYSDYDNENIFRSGGSSVCSCSSNLYNCESFSTQFEAQVCYEHCLSTVGRDIHWLDGDDDGTACEWNP